MIYTVGLIFSRRNLDIFVQTAFCDAGSENEAIEKELKKNAGEVLEGSTLLNSWAVPIPECFCPLNSGYHTYATEHPLAATLFINFTKIEEDAGLKAVSNLKNRLEPVFRDYFPNISLS